MGDLADVPVIGAAETAALLPYADLADALDAGHRLTPATVGRLVDGPPERGETLLLLSAWDPGAALGVKLVTVFPQNPRAGLASVQAVYVLFDGATGSPVAIIDGTELTYRKTAASSALASRYLSRADSTTLLMVGAGGLAPHLVAAHRAVRPAIDRVLVWNRTPAAAERLAASIEGGRAVTDLATAVGAADIVCTATMSDEPLVEGRLLEPGTHLDCVGAFRPDCREVDDEVVRRATLYVDSPAAIEESGDLAIPLSAGVITRADIAGDLYGLCRGEVAGRTSVDAITLYESLGGGHLDLMTARALHARRTSTPAPGALP